MKFTNLVRQYNINRDPDHMVISFLFYVLCIYIRYLLSVILTIMINCRWYYRYWSWGRDADFQTVTSVYQHFWSCGFLIESFVLILTIPFWVCSYSTSKSLKQFPIVRYQNPFFFFPFSVLLFSIFPMMKLES